MNNAQASDLIINKIRTEMGVKPGNQVGSSLEASHHVRLQRYIREKNADWNDRAHWVAGIAQQAVIHKAANCGEFAALAFCMFYNLKQVTPFEYFVGLNFDHAFVVVGRGPYEPTSQPEQWNANAVICDAWAGETITPADFKSRLPGMGCDRQQAWQDFHMNSVIRIDQFKFGMFTDIWDYAKEVRDFYSGKK
jgi:hypothetical protein